MFAIISYLIKETLTEPFLVLVFVIPNKLDALLFVERKEEKGQKAPKEPPDKPPTIKIREEIIKKLNAVSTPFVILELMAERMIQLQPKKSYHFWWYVIGVLLTPILVGFYILYKRISELSKTHYKITDQTITSVNPNYTETVDIANINEVKVHQRWINKQFGIGSLQLITNTRKVDLVGLENPKNLSDIILKAAEAERYRMEQQLKKEQEKPKPSHINLDKLDYLTGLWQQGLISNDDYLREKKHFDDN